MMRYSACVDMLFTGESADVAQRIRLAKAAGMDAVEFWLWSNKDLDAIEDALGETGLPLAGIVAEPFAELTRTSDHQRFLDGLEKSLVVAQRLGTRVMIAQAGPDLAGIERNQQHDALVEAMARSAEVLKGSGVVLALEPLNTLVDHVGYYLPSTTEGLDIVDAVNRPEIKILYDLYHSMVMGEDTATVLAGRVDRVAHIHVADHVGRNQPGTGKLPLKASLDCLFANGYNGFVGLEFKPIGGTAAALDETVRILGR
ncbi:hydroxypyruvate isomerase [Devosia epidermidihirudinis]|uniref:Hydroxypyruvate isomerase n=1 Tax=Devosia epidermidihirudinis TaxID=1293439 RepID=A0A0F5QAI4_9HYPH|nr:TIM barrel protein [Devosia epidermidihirudinis]KKC37721.1 hydroxypyruvate isomerase [Devosia epidermidihirudinis]